MKNDMQIKQEVLTELGREQNVAAGSVGLTAIHLKAGVGGVRPIVSGVLGVLALVLALAPTEQSPIEE